MTALKGKRTVPVVLNKALDSAVPSLYDRGTALHPGRRNGVCETMPQIKLVHGSPPGWSNPESVAVESGHLD
jgi:hypothetical protein